MKQEDAPSTRPYLIRALHEWCTDHGFAPYLAVQVDASVHVPREFVKNGEIVLNVSFDATSQLKLGNETIEFRARFGGVARDIVVPVDHVVAIYARENGQGMAFPAPPPAAAGASLESATGQEAPTSAAPALQLVHEEDQPHPSAVSGGAPSPESEPPPPSAPTGRPALKRVK